MTKIKPFFLSIFFFSLAACGEAVNTETPSLPFDNNLIAHWTFDDTNTSSTVSDTRGSNNLQLENVDLNNAWIPGKVNGALHLDGIDDKVINYQVTKDLQPPHLTLSGWIRVKQGSWQWVAAQGDNYGLYLNENHQLVFYARHDDGWMSAMAQHLNFIDNQWHHIAGSYNGQALKVYFDGSEVANTPENRAIRYTTGNQFTIGSMQGERLLAGDIDDIRVYRGALSDTEIHQLKHMSQQQKTAPRSIARKPARDPCRSKTKPHYYVSPTGNNENSGNRLAPWKTLTYAASQLKCGTLHIKAGIYKENVTFTHSGTPDNYIKIVGEKGAIIDGGFGYDDASKGLVTIKDASYIILEGITVRNALTHGIYYTGKGSHIRIRHCKTEHTRGAGIYIYGQWPFTGYHINNVIISHNKVLWPQEGAGDGNLIWQEDITLAGGIENFEISYNYVNAYNSKDYHIHPVGIDVKTGVRNGVIHHNTVENIPSNGIYVDAGESEAVNIKVYQNVVKNVSGYGISIAGEDGGKLDRIDVFNNLIETSGYSGIAFYDYDPNSERAKYPLQPRTNINIYNNTIYNAGYSNGWGWGIMTESQFHGSIYNNVIANSKPSALKLGHRNTRAVTHNCIGNNQQGGDTGQHAIQKAPRFKQPDKGDFNLLPGSPCIDTGISTGAPSYDLTGKKRPQGKGYDRGAYEYSP